METKDKRNIEDTWRTQRALNMIKMKRRTVYHSSITGRQTRRPMNKHTVFILCFEPFTVCLESSHPRPAVNMIGLIHSTLSLLGRRCPKDRANPHTTGSPYLLPATKEREARELMTEIRGWKKEWGKTMKTKRVDVRSKRKGEVQEWRQIPYGLSDQNLMIHRWSR